MKTAQQFKFKRHSVIVTSLIVIGLFLTACGASEPETFTIGVVNLTPLLDSALAGFKDSMVEQGYIEGEKVTYIYEGATGSIDTLDTVAQELVEADVDLILSITTPATQAAQRAVAKTDIPIIFVPVTDPVGAGIVQSLRQPGGNITGVTTGGAEEARLQWQLTMASGIKKIYIPYNPDGSTLASLAAAEAAASKLNVELIPQIATNPDEVLAAIEIFPEDVNAIFFLNDGFMETQIDKFVEVALERNIPLSGSHRGFVEAGALFAFGHRHYANGQLAASLANQIFEGTKPADLPVETAETFLVVNLKTAQAIGLEVPYDVLETADEIIRE